MADNNKNEYKGRIKEKSVGSGHGVAPGDTIASALDPFGSAAGAISREDLGNKVENSTSDEGKTGNKNKR